MSIDIVVDDAIQSMVVVVDGGPVAQFSAESNGTAAALHCTYLSYRSIPHSTHLRNTGARPERWHLGRHNGSSSAKWQPEIDEEQ